MKTLNNVEALLRETDPSQIAELFAEADTVRRENIGDAVHFRALIELSNRCTRSCGYCGLRVENNALTRYEMTDEEILDSLQKALALDYHTVVLQAGECPSLSCERITNLVRKIKELAPIAVTLSLGEQPQATYEAWREAGADRYLLRFETSNPQLYSAIHPHAANAEEHPRIAPLRQLQELGYEVGSGMLVGIPSQTYRDLAADILLLQELQLDMIGLGPFLVHPATPLATPESCGLQNAGAEQVPATAQMVYKCIALARLVCPAANIPSTTALATLAGQTGRRSGLSCGANIVMPNFTPIEYQRLYEIYPGKATCQESAAQNHREIVTQIKELGRTVGKGRGDAKTKR